MLTYNNKASWLNTIWDALEVWRSEEVAPATTTQWENICTAMVWIAEELDVEQEDLE